MLADLDAFTIISFCVMLLIVCVGTAGNLVVLFVYSRKTDKQTANVFIISLAISDLIACTLVIPMTIYMESVEFCTYRLLCKLYYLLNSSGIPFSCMLISAIALDRYFCICRPFLRAITTPRAKCIALALGTLAVALGVTTATFCSDVVTQLPINNTSDESRWVYADYGICKEINDINSLNSSSLFVSPASLAFFKIFQKFHLSLFGVCIVTVVVLYICIYISVLRMRSKRRQLKGQNVRQLQQQQQQQQHQDEDEVEVAEDETTRASSAAKLLKRRRKSLRAGRESDALQNLKTAAMLFVVTLVFASTFVPAAMMSVGALPFNILVFYMYYLSHATNPLIYCFMNQNFRVELQKLFCGRKNNAGARKQHQTISLTTAAAAAAVRV